MFHKSKQDTYNNRTSIDYFLERSIDRLVEFQESSVQKNKSSQLEKSETSRLVTNLQDLMIKVNSYTGGYEDIIPRMINNNFYYTLAQLSTNDRDLFNELTDYFKILVNYTLNIDCAKYQHQIGEILGRFLYEFTAHDLLVEHQLPFLNRLVINTIKICNLYPDIIDTWINPKSKKFTSYIKSKDQKSRLPLFTIINNFLRHDSEYDQSDNIIELFKLTQKSNKLTEYLLKYQDFADFFICKCQKIMIQLSRNANDYQAVNKFCKIFDTIYAVVEKSNLAIGSIYYTKFETFAINPILKQNNNLVFSIMSTVSKSDTITIFEKMFRNPHFKLCLDKSFQHHNQVILLQHLTNLFQKHESMLSLLLDCKESESDSNTMSLSMKDLLLQAIHICDQETDMISSIMCLFLRTKFNQIESYNFNSQKVIAKNYFKILSNYFQNDPSLNIEINKFSSVIFLKVNFLNNEQGVQIIGFLGNAYYSLIDVLKKYNKYRFDTLELEKISQSNDYFARRQSFLNTIEVTEDIDSELFDYSILEENLQLFKKFFCELYVHCKFKKIVYTSSLDSP